MDLMGTFGNALFHIALVGPIFPEIHETPRPSDWIELEKGGKRELHGEKVQKKTKSS